jgi:hypothetical protein
MMKTTTAVTIMILIVAICAVCGFFYGLSRYQAGAEGGYKPRNNDDDGSPIIVTGGSIHFAQRNRWSYQGPNTIAARLPGHKPNYFEIGYFDGTFFHSKYPAVVPPAHSNDPGDLKGKDWTMYLCTSTPCDSGHAVATIDYKQDGDDNTGHHDSDAVTITGSSQFFQTDTTVSSPSMLLGDASTVFAYLSLSTDPNAKCPPLSDGQKCMVRLCYTQGQNSTCSY